MKKDLVLDIHPETVEKSVGKLREPYLMAVQDEWENLKKHYQSKRCALFKPVTPCKDTVFHVAAYKGSVNMLRVLFEMVQVSRKQEVFMMKNIHGNTLLHEAATSNNVNAAKFLVQNGRDEAQADMLVDRNKLGETPLYRAAVFGDQATVEYLSNVVETEVPTGNLQDHFTRSCDSLSILHSAIMKEQFETAIWLLEKDAELAKRKTSDEMTCLHFLASMPTAFESSSRGMHGQLKSTIYRHFPDNLKYWNKTGKHVSNQSCKTTKKNHQPMAGLSMKDRFWIYLIEGWKLIKEVQNMKKKHGLAVKLADKLVEMDSCSWLEHFNSESEEYNKIICFSRGMKNDKKETGEALAKDRRATGEAASNTGGGDITVVVPPETPLIVAARTGIMEIVNLILNMHPQALQHVTRNGQNILHVAILHRHDDLFERVKKEGEAVKRRLVLGIDDDGDTILHKAASTVYYRAGASLSLALELQEELRRFNVVKNMVPPHYSIHRNNNGDTAEELFKKQHEKQLKDAQEWVKITCQSCSAVAVLVATVVYAAAFTAPGGFISVEGDTGRPVPNVGHAVLENQPLYSFFMVMDISGLASSLTSLVIFLSGLTSSLDQHDFRRTIPQRLTLGFTLLFFAIATTVLSFTASIILTVHLRKKWTTTLTFAAAFLPVGVYVLVQFGLYIAYLKSAVSSIWVLLKKLLPGGQKE